MSITPTATTLTRASSCVSPYSERAVLSYRRDGLVVVLFGAREALAAGVGVLLPVVAALQEPRKFRRVVVRDGLPVVEAEVLCGVYGAICGEDRPARCRRRQREGARVPGRGRVLFRDPVAFRAVTVLTLLALETAQEGPVRGVRSEERSLFRS